MNYPPALNLNDITFTGSGLVRPECVLATAAGNLYVSDFRGGVSRIAPDGQCTFFGGGEVAGREDPPGILKPNGICLLPDGSFLVAHLGTADGGVYRIDREHNIEPWLLEVEGQPLPPSNFIYLDHQGRYWLTVSTRQIPRAKGYRSDVQDGFIVLIDQHSARIVADNIGYTNEVYVTPDGNTLYVNATFSRGTLRYDIDANNNLINPTLAAQYGQGIYPDGLTMDTEGYLWVTSIVSNSVVRVNPNSGETRLMLQDVDQAHLQWVEQAYLTHQMGRPHLDNVKSERLNNISSLAFSGNDLSKINMGCLLGQQVAQIASVYQGLKPSHWHFDD
ncbi:gluconolactonase [Alteromonas aestuariivivens]|uniref:Gluconolactonase n=1 Tax=Alteromonas aestuariivivens TaxID=1938339 RepID=A0A3D8MF81_9ALTE|nr:SMP-30/gluconolactonase/LRE family protein [Alteromonas aestuariivivens]RDV29423.1 gluconolactonase [Alteromonas aestuariivivens]